MPFLLRQGTSVFKVISERPVILTSKCHALGEGEPLSIHVLGLTQPERSGLELKTSEMLSKSATTRLSQPVLYPHHDLNNVTCVPANS